MAKKTLHIISHSHWDREWYMPFEKHRFRLVELLDAVIDEMEKDPDFRYYHLDGQYIAIEDYLAIRPEMGERLWKLIREGRIQIGPWYVLQDEYLTSGESNVRNMLYGLALCKAGGASPVMTGYFPDAFGNISQAPQILRGFGIDSAVFGRGVNDVLANNETVKEKGITRSELRWRSPDGSEVLGVLMANWYHNAMELPQEEKALKERLTHILATTGRVAGTEHLLGMNGCDHQPLQRGLSKVIALSNQVQEEAEVVHSCFPDYIAALTPHLAEFPVYEGEINGQLSEGRNPLICTASAHGDIKQDNHRVEHLLSRVAEPLSALATLYGGEYRSHFLLYAWKTLMQNHPHDSICTCSCDEVYREMKARFEKAAAVGEEIRDHALEELTCALVDDAQREEKTLWVYSLAPGDTPQRVSALVDFLPEEQVEAISVFDGAGNEIPAKVTVERDAFTYTLPKDSFRKARRTDRFRVELQVRGGGIGWQTYTVKKCPSQRKTAVLYSENTLENEFLRLKAQPDGTLDITDKRTGNTYPGQHLFEDSQDRGNLYNYVPLAEDTPRTAKAAETEVTLGEITPFSASLQIRTALSDAVKITSIVTLAEGVARVDFKTTVENRGENHRLRVLFPTGIQTETLLAEGQFDLVRRSISPSEVWRNPCNAQRMQAFVLMEDEGKGALIATRGLCEYEALRDEERTLAITLLRAIGEIGDWGDFPTPQGQMQGEYTLEYAFVPFGSKERETAIGAGYTFAYPTLVAKEGKGQGSGTLLSWEDPLLLMTALKQAENGDGLILRLYNAAEEERMLSLSLGERFTSVGKTPLSEEGEEPLALLDGRVQTLLSPKKILTLRLHFNK